MVFIGNLFGFVAIVLFILSYQFKTRKAIIICNMTSRCFYVVQYILLGAWSGAVFDFMAMLISAVTAKGEKSWKQYALLAVLYAVIVVAGIMLYVNIFSILSLIGVTFELAAFLLTKERDVRLVSLAGQPFWITYNFAYRAWSSVLGNIITVVSIIVALIRYDFKGSKGDCAK